MSATLLDVDAVRARYSALQRPLAFFDGPGGTQCPDEVIDAISAYLRESNANIDAPYETSIRTVELVDLAHEKAAAFLGCSAGEVAFGPSMTALNFLLSRALARTFRAGDEVVVTALDHDANVAPWLEIAHDLGIVVRVAGLTPELQVDYEDVARLLSDRTRVVAYPWASNGVGTITDVRRIADLAHDAGALAWVDAVHYAPHGPIDVQEAGADLLLCSPYKFYGPHLGLFWGREELLERLRPYKVRPAPDHPAGARFETGTLPHEALAGFVAAVEYVEELGWPAITAHERTLAERFVARLPDGLVLHGLPTAEGRTPTFALSVPGRTPHEAAARLAEREIAVWSGDYYAFEIMNRLGLPDGAVRVGFVHYNTEDEVDRVLAGLSALL